MEVYYEQTHGLQVPTTNNFFTIVCKTSLQSYLIISTLVMKRSTLQQHKEATMLCEEGMTITKTRNELSVPHNTKEVTLVKTHSNTRKTNKHCINCGMANHNVETCKKNKEIDHNGNQKGHTTKSKTT